MVRAFASPMPGTFIRSLTVSFANSCKSFPVGCNTFLARSTALVARVPDPNKIAINSASDRADFPFRMSFSRGRSSGDQLLMLRFLSAFIIMVGNDWTKIQARHAKCYTFKKNKPRLWRGLINVLEGYSDLYASLLTSFVNFDFWLAAFFQ